MISDLNKDISLITYNHLNLPTRIEMTQGVIEYFYTASGVKQHKKVTEGNNVTETFYAGGFVYTKTQATTLLQDFDFYFTPEGYAKKENGILSYVYQYKDHLGNVRLSYKDNNGVLEIIEENNYYPFGLKHEGYNAVISSGGNSTAQKYQYNGKEWQVELGLRMYDMDMRQYDPAIARWVVIDPVVHHDFSPYNAFDNNPVFWADPSGADAVETDDAYVFTGEDAQNVFSNLQKMFRENVNDSETMSENDDWIYDKKTQTYVWDENAKNEDTTPQNHEYVGKKISDVDNHFDIKHWIRSFFGRKPNINYTSYLSSKASISLNNLFSKMLEAKNNGNSNWGEVSFLINYFKYDSSVTGSNQHFFNYSFDFNGVSGNFRGTFTTHVLNPGENFYLKTLSFDGKKATLDSSSKYQITIQGSSENLIKIYLNESVYNLLLSNFYGY